MQKIQRRLQLHLVETQLQTVKLENVRNVRDLGNTAVFGGRHVKPGLFFRGSALNKASDADLACLSKRCGIRRVIDIRVGWERDSKPDRDVPGAENLFIPFFDKEIVGIDYHKPLEGTRSIGHDFACDSIDFYRTMPNPLTVKQMRTVVQTTLESASRGEPVYLHCSGGKDRVGIAALLILEVLGASREDILKDYLLTNKSRDAHIQGVYERFLRLCDGDEERARQITYDHRARPENIQAFYDEVETRYGSMEGLIHEQLAISEADRERFRASCTTSAQ